MAEYGTLGRKASAVLLNDLELEQRREQRLKIKSDLLAHFKEVQAKKEQTDDDTTENEESDEEEGSPKPKRYGRALSNASRSSSFTVIDHSSSTPETRSRASSISDQPTERSTASIDSDDDAESNANRNQDPSSEQEDTDQEGEASNKSASSSDEEIDDIDELRDRLATSKRLVKEYRLKMEALVTNIGEYKKLMEIEKKSVEQKVSKESEALEQKVKELQAELQSSKTQYDEMVEAYEAKLDEVEEEKKARNKENIENLQTLVKELTYIEDINSQLNNELDVEKQASEKLKQELEISKQVIKQLEIKLARLQEQALEERSKSLSMSSDSNSNDSDSQFLRSQLQVEREKVQRVALLISQMRTIVFPSEEIANQEMGTVAMKLEAEKEEHVKTKQALEQEKEKRNEDKQTIDRLQKRIKDLIQSHSAALSQVNEGGNAAAPGQPTRKMTLQYSPSLMNLAQIKPDSIPGVVFEAPKPQEAPAPVKAVVAPVAPAQATTSPVSTPSKDLKKDKEKEAKKKKKLTEEEKVALLFQWVEEGNPKLDDFAKMLKSSKTLVKATDSAGRTALHKACFNGFAPLIKPLLSAGAEVNAQDKSGWTALHHALKCPQDNSEIVKILLKKSDIKVDIPNFDNNICLHFLIRSPSFHVDFLNSILSRGVNVNLTNNNGETPLHYCCLEAGHESAAEILFKHNANANIQNKRQETPLHYAARVGLEKMVTFLLDHGADANIKGVDGTALEVTNSESIKQLLQNAHQREQNRLSLKRSRRITIQVPAKTIEQLGITNQVTPSGQIDKRPEELAAETSHRRDSLRNSSVTIAIKSPDMTLKSSISPEWTVAHLLASVRKKFPENCSSFNLFLMENPNTIVKLDETKIVLDYPKLMDIKELHFRPDEKGLQKSFSAPNPPSSPETARLRRATVSASKFKQQIEEFQELVDTNNIQAINQNKFVMRSKSMKQFKGGSAQNSDSESGSSTSIKDMFHAAKNSEMNRTSSTSSIVDTHTPRTLEQLTEIAQAKEGQVTLLQAVSRRYLARKLKKKYLMHNEARKNVARDILKLETTHLEALKYILSRFIKPVRDSKHVPRLMKDNILDIGTSLESIQLQTVQLVVALQQRIDGWFPGQRLGDLYMRINTEMVEYPAYASCYYEILPLFKEKQFVSTLQKCNVGDMSTLTKHLKSPVDYLFKLRKYIKLFLPYTGSDHKDTKDFRTILQSTKKAVDEIRTTIDDYDNRDQLQKIQSMVTNTIPFNLVSSNRIYVKEGELEQKTKTTIKRRLIILFSDLIFVAERTSKLHMKYIEHIVLKPDTLASDYTMGGADKKAPTTFSFLVTSGGSEPLILITKSEEERKGWVDAIKTAITAVKLGGKIAEDLTNPEAASQSMIYQDAPTFSENKRHSISSFGHSWSTGAYNSINKGAPLVLGNTKGSVSANVVSVLTQEACAVCLTKFGVKIRKTNCKKCGNAVCPNCISKSDHKTCLNCLPQGANTGPFPLLSLPEKLLMHVCYFLEPQSLCAVFLTCKNLRNLGSKSRLWKGLYLTRYNKPNLPNHSKDVYKQQYMIESRWENNKYSLSFLKAHTQPISSLKLTQDFLISASKDMTIKIWNLQTATPTLSSSLIAQMPIRSMTYNPAKHTVVTGAEKVIKIWDIQSMKSVGSVDAHTGGVVSLHYDTQRDTILSAGTDNTVKVIDVKTMKVVSTLVSESSPITCMQVHGNFLALGTGKQMKLYTYPEGGFVQTLGEHGDSIRCLKMNSHFIAAGYHDGAIKIFQTSKLGHGKTVTAHSKPINDIHFDYNKLVSVSSDSTIKIWSLVSSKTTSLHVNGEVSAIDFDNRGLLVSAHSDNIIRCWNYAWKA